MLLNEKKAKIRELTNNGPVPEARFPEEPNSPPPAEEEEKPKRGGKSTRGKAPTKTTRASIKKPSTTLSRGKRKRTPTPEPEMKDDEPMPDVDDIDEGEASATADESAQGDDERDADVERVFGVRNDQGDVTEDEEL
jgi:hypothetical protein